MKSKLLFLLTISVLFSSTTFAAMNPGTLISECFTDNPPLRSVQTYRVGPNQYIAVVDVEIGTQRFSSSLAVNRESRTYNFSMSTPDQNPTMVRFESFSYRAPSAMSETTVYFRFVGDTKVQSTFLFCRNII